MTTKAIALVALSAATLVLGGCDSTRRLLGMERTVPDESTVASNRPLVMPPDFNLRPPSSATERVDGTRITSFTAGSRPDTLLQSSQTQDGKPIGSSTPTVASDASSTTTTTEKKSERGFFGRLFNSWFGSGKDEETERAEREAKQSAQ